MTASHTHARHEAEVAGRKVRQVASSRWVKIYAHVGYAAKGIVYLIIGGLAAATALGGSGALTDQTGAERAIYQQPLGAVLLFVAAIGWLGFALWCEIEALLDPDDRGLTFTGIIGRFGYGVVGLIYAGLAIAAIGLATRGGGGAKNTNTQARDWTALLLRLPVGVALVVISGVVVVGIAAVLFYRAYSAEFRRQLGGPTGEVRKGIIWLGRLGYTALGVIFTIVGIFLIVAAAQRNPGVAKGLGGALATVLRQPFGHALLALLALGLIAYGAYSLAEARYRHIGSA